MRGCEQANAAEIYEMEIWRADRRKEWAVR